MGALVPLDKGGITHLVKTGFLLGLGIAVAQVVIGAVSYGAWRAYLEWGVAAVAGICVLVLGFVVIIATSSLE